jgi:hypothetical protein
MQILVDIQREDGELVNFKDLEKNNVPIRMVNRIHNQYKAIQFTYPPNADDGYFYLYTVTENNPEDMAAQAGDWMVVDEQGNILIYTDEEFRKVFEFSRGEGYWTNKEI